METDNKEYRYFAFISYNSHDTAWGKRLQRKLEHYRMPATVCSVHGWKRTPINPVWFAPTDIQPGGLDEELKKRLRDSRNLIVICSPSSARSEWVGKEIRYFHELGRDNSIHFFIVDGIPNSGDPATECFNPVVRELGIPEILGANIHERIYRWPWLNRERAYVQLISKLLGVEYDAIWQRHRRLMIQKAVVWAVGVVAVAATIGIVWSKSQPFDVTVGLDEVSVANPGLPPLHDARVAMTLDRETLCDTVAGEGEAAVFLDIPHKYYGKQVRVEFRCQDFLPVDTTVVLGENVSLNIRRDPAVYGSIEKKLWDWEKETGVGNTPVEIDGRQMVSDADGMVRLDIPLGEQKEHYIINIPSWHRTDTVFMPCNEGQVIIVNENQ